MPVLNDKWTIHVDGSSMNQITHQGDAMKPYSYRVPAKPKLKQSPRQLKRAQRQPSTPLVKVEAAKAKD